MQKVLVVDAVRCDGCRACELACSTVKEGEANLHKSRIRPVRFPDLSFNYPLVCQQCETPLCAAPCPTAALPKDPETGIVQLIKERCVGCKMCLLACPFGAISLVNGFPAKCDLCGGDPACVRLCEPKALALGSPDDLGEAQRLMTAEKLRQVHVGKA